MQPIRISDMTIKQSGKAGAFSLTFREKLELCKQLDRLGVSVIELEAIEQPKADSLLIKSVASAVKDSCVAVPVKLNADSVSITWHALNEARKPRLQVAAPVSPVQMEYLFHKKPDAMLSAISETIAACRACTPDVEFVADDATRSDTVFLHQVIRAAIEAGAGTITLCDAAGAMLPDEFAALFSGLYEAVPELKSITVGASCANDLAMADACAVAAVQQGVREIKAVACGAQWVSLGNIARVLAARSGEMKLSVPVHMTEMKRALNQIDWMCQTARKKASPFDNGVLPHDEGLNLTSHDDEAAVMHAVERLGYDLSAEDAEKVWAAFQRIADRKEQITTRELDAIVAAEAMQVPPAYQVESYVINTGSHISAMAHMRLMRNGRVLDGISVGDGAIDAAFLAIEQIAGKHYELDDFQIQAVTEGREAMGQTVVKLRSNGRLYSGRGISTDIVGAGIMAYLNALNKIVYEEEEA